MGKRYSGCGFASEERIVEREREGRGDREEIAVEAFLGGSEEYAKESRAAIREGKRRNEERGEGD